MNIKTKDQLVTLHVAIIAINFVCIPLGMLTLAYFFLQDNLLFLAPALTLKAFFWVYLLEYSMYFHFKRSFQLLGIKKDTTKFFNDPQKVQAFAKDRIQQELLLLIALVAVVIYIFIKS